MPDEIERVVSNVSRRPTEDEPPLPSTFLPTRECARTQALEFHLKDVQYEDARVAHWIDGICDDCIKGLTQLGKPFKYAVTAAIMQKNGAGLNSASACYWDTVNDGNMQIRWPSDKNKDQNKTMVAIVTVFCSQL